MTERTLPSIGVGIRTRPAEADRTIPAPRTATAERPLVARREAVLSTPARAGMLFGVTAAVYAVALAGVSGLQAESDAAVVAARAPHVDALAATRAANDALQAKLQDVDGEVRWLARSYDTIGLEVEAYQARLDALALLVADVQGSAAALPDRIRLPSVTMRGAVATGGGGGGGTAAPRTSGRTGASGG